MSWEGKQLNLRLAVVLLLLAVLLPIGVSLLHSQQVSRSAKLMLERGEEALKKDRTDEAIRCFRYCVDYMPNDKALFTRLALLQADQARNVRGSTRELWEVYPKLQQAVVQDPDNVELLRRVADVSVELGRLEAAHDFIARLSKTFPDDPDLLIKLGRCLIAKRDYKLAVDTLNRGLARDPKNLTAYVELANLLRDKMSKPAEADQVVERMVAANPQNGRAYVYRATFVSRAGRHEQASQDVTKAVELAPQDVEVLLLAAESAGMGRRYAEAQKYLETAKEVAPNDDRIDRRLCDFWTMRGQYDKALVALRRVMQRNPDDYFLLPRLADLNSWRKDVAELRNTIRHMEKARFSRQQTQFYEAEALREEKRYQQAMELLEKLRQGPRRSLSLMRRIDVSLANCYEPLGMPDRQLEVYQRLVEGDPRDLASRVGLTAALFQTGRPDRAMGECLRLIASTNMDEFAQLRSLRRSYYQTMASYISRLPVPQRKWSDLDRLVAAMEKLTKDEDRIETAAIKADLLLRQGNAAAARALLDQQRRVHPGAASLAVTLANIVGQQDIAEAVKILKPTDKLADCLELRLAVVPLALRLGLEKGAPLLEGLERGGDKFTRDEQLKLYRGVGLGWYQFRDAGRTRRLWRMAAEVKPDDRLIRIMLFEVGRETNDETAMFEALAMIERMWGAASPEWRYCEASRLVWRVRNRQGDRRLLELAGRYLKQAGQARPRWQMIACLDAEIDILDGRLEEAVRAFRNALDTGALSPAHLGQYARLLYIRGEYKDAREIFAQLSGNEVSGPMKMLGSELELRQGNLPASIELAAASVANSKNPIDFLWYGEFLHRAGRRVEAEKQFRIAVTMGSAIPEAWLALIHQQLINGNRTQAWEAIRSAQLCLPEDRVPYLLAQCYESLGDFPRAEQYYVAATVMHPEDFTVAGRAAAFLLVEQRRRAAEGLPDADHKARALGYLYRLIAMGARSNSSDRPILIWARRTLAASVSDDGGYQQQEQALQLIDQNAIGGHLSPDDMQIKARILSQRPLLQSLLQASQLLEAVRRDSGRLAPSEQLRLARLYDRTDRWTLAQREMTDLIRAQPNEVEFLTAYVQMLLRRKEPTTQIEPWIAQLDKLAPDAMATIGAKSQLLHRNGETPEAMELLERLVVRPFSLQTYDRLKYAASVMEEIGQIGPATKLLTEYAEMDPAGRLTLAVFLSRHATLKAALDQCETALAKLPPADVIPVVISVFAAKQEQAKPDDFDRVEKWFDKIRAQTSDPKAVLLQQAAFWEIQKRYADVSRLYRDFLARTDVSERERAVVSNNLAYLMAVQSQDAAKALAMINQAISVLGPSPQLRDTRALALLAAGQKQEAVDELRRAIADQPSGIAYFHLALALMAQREYQASSQALQTARNEHHLKPSEIPPIERDRYQELLSKIGPL